MLAPSTSKLSAAVGWLLLALLALGIGVTSWMRGGEFYGLDFHTRVDHADYRLLSPGRVIGHSYGVVGTALILTNLLYLARRRLVGFRLGSMKLWLNLHVATGLLGGELVLFHSALQLRNQLATVTMASLGIVVVTGLIGRFIYALVPKPDLEGLRQHCLVFDSLAPGLGQSVMKRLNDAQPTSIVGRVTLIKVLFTLRRWREDARERRRIVTAACEEYEHQYPRVLDSVRPRVIKAARIAAQVPTAVAFDHVMRTWRGMHRFFALLMILLVSVHIGVAWYFGYRWITSDAVQGL